MPIAIILLQGKEKITWAHEDQCHPLFITWGVKKEGSIDLISYNFNFVMIILLVHLIWWFQMK